MGPLGNQPWSLSVRAKSKGMDLRLQASHLLLDREKSGFGSRFSVFLRIQRFLLRVKSGSGDPVPREKRRFKALRFPRNVFRRRHRSTVTEVAKTSEVEMTGNRVTENNAGHFSFRAPVPTMMGSLSLISHSASKKDHEGITIHALTFLFYLSLLFNTKKTPIPLLLVATAISLTGFSLSYLSYIDHVPEAAWKAWHFFVSTYFLSTLTQVIYSRMSLPVLRNWLGGLSVFGLLPFLPYELDMVGMLSKGMMAALEVAPVWIPRLLVTCQAFSHVLTEPRDLKAVGVYISSAYLWAKEII